MVLVGEAPGRSEVSDGRPFSGPSGKLLDATLAEVGSSREAVYITNTVLCRPTDAQGNDAPPAPAAVRACSQRLAAEVRSVGSSVVVAVGGTAATALTGAAKVSDVVGALHFSEPLGRYVLPTYHPAAVLHGGTGFFDDIYNTLWRAHRLSTGVVPLPKPGGPELDWHLILDPDAAISWLDTLRTRPFIVIDTESTGTKWMTDRFIMLQLYWGTGTAIAIHADAFTGPVRALMQQLLRDRRIRWGMWNKAYDLQVVRAVFDVDLNERPDDHVLDGMCLAAGLTERMEQQSLKYQARQWLNASYYEKELADSGFKWGMWPDEKQTLAMAKYGCLDVYYTWELLRLLPDLVREEGTMDLARDLLNPAQASFADIEFEGCKVDLEYAAGLEEQWLPLIEEARDKIQVYAQAQGFPKNEKLIQAQQIGVPCPDCTAGSSHASVLGGDRKFWRSELQATPFGDPSCTRCMKRRFILVPDRRLNVNSYPQMQHLAFDILRMRMADGRRSCDESWMAVNGTHPLVEMLKEYRERNHLLTNYIRNIAQHTWPDGRVHPDFLIGGTVTGRLAIHNPPLQTLPKWGVNPEMSKLIRRIFVPWADDEVIVDIDYKNLELFIAWHYSGDENLGHALTGLRPDGTPMDFHTNTASAIFAKAYEDVTGFDRFNSKFVTFGIAYGRQAYSLAQGELKEITGGDERKAQEYIDRLWDMYPKWADQYFRWQDDALTKGELVTTLGRKRRWRLITPQTVNAIKNQAVNFPMQSLASDTCLSALIRTNRGLKERKWGRVLFTVHDSLVYSIKRAHLDEALDYITREMVTPPYKTHIKLAVEVEVGPSLGEVQEYIKEAA